MRCRGAWRLRAPILAAVAVLAAAGCAQSAPAGRAPSASTPIPAAQAKVFVPVTASVSKTVHGSCWTRSITVGSPSAYRCTAGNHILDPCFAASGTAHEVVCYADPWTRGVRVVLAKPLPKTAPLLITHPWAIELANGKQCVTATGVVARVGGLALVYRCDGGGATGEPDTSGDTSVRYVAPGSHRSEPMSVSVIWQV